MPVLLVRVKCGVVVRVGKIGNNPELFVLQKQNASLLGGVLREFAAVFDEIVQLVGFKCLLNTVLFLHYLIFSVYGNCIMLTGRCHKFLRVVCQQRTVSLVGEQKFTVSVHRYGQPVILTVASVSLCRECHRKCVFVPRASHICTQAYRIVRCGVVGQFSRNSVCCNVFKLLVVLKNGIVPGFHTA